MRALGSPAFVAGAQLQLALLCTGNADNLALKKENEELIRANEDWKRRFEGKERELATQQKAVIKLQYLVEWYMSREQRFKAVSRAEMEELVEEQSHGQKQMENVRTPSFLPAPLAPRCCSCRLGGRSDGPEAEERSDEQDGAPAADVRVVRGERAQADAHAEEEGG